MFIKAKIQSSDGSPLPADAKIYPENNFLNTFFSQCEVLLNETIISPGSVHYAYRSYIENLLNYTRDAKDTHLTTAGFFTPQNEESYAEKFKKSKDKVFEVFGKVHGDFMHQDRLLLNNVDMKIKFTRSPSAYHIRVADNSSHDPVIKILECYLYVRRVKLTATMQLNIEQQLMSRNCLYPLRRAETRFFTLPAQIQSKSLDNIALGALPQRFICGLLNHSAVTGNYKENSFNFKHFNLRSISLHLNGNSVGKGFECIYSDSEDKISLCTRAYHSVFSGIGALNELGNGISINDYVSNGMCLYSWDLSQDLCSNAFSHINPQRQGELSLKLSFEKTSGTPITVFVYMEYVNNLEIDRSRTIIQDY